MGCGVLAFTLILTSGVGNLFVLTTSIDIAKGSLSQVAADLREKSELLEQERQLWELALAGSGSKSRHRALCP